MIRTGWLAALAFALSLPSTGFAQGGGMVGMGGGMMGGRQEAPKDTEEWTVTIVTATNSAVTGRLRLVTVAIYCDLGFYEIRPDKIKEVQFGPLPRDAQVMFDPTGGAQRQGVLLTTSGEKIEGTVSLPQWWRVKTDLGTLTPGAQQIKSLTFVARVEHAGQPTSNKPGDPTKPNGDHTKHGGESSKQGDKP